MPTQGASKVPLWLRKLQAAWRQGRAHLMRPFVLFFCAGDRGDQPLLTRSPVQCDESKPTCSRCAASRFHCSYSRGAAAALQPAYTSVFPVGLPHILPAPPPHLRIPVASPVPGQFGEYELRPRDYERLSRFAQRSVMTMGSGATRRLFPAWSLRLASANPFLCHVYLAFSLLHDLYLSPGSSSTPAHRASLAFHWYHATAILNHKLADPQPPDSPSERDALMTSASMLAASAFANVEDASDPEKAWPLRPAGPSDLDWLRMSDGKKVVRDLSGPLPPDSFFRRIFDDLGRLFLPDGQPPPPIPPDALPPAFFSLYDLACPHAPDRSPYYLAAFLLARLLRLDASSEDLSPHFGAFLLQLDARLRALLHVKDPRALLLLAWWYAKTLQHTAWWLRCRGLVEGRAICIHLERRCGQDARVAELLRFPKTAFGLV
ncbi:hypothetical protein VTK73DRAFT_10413 [Phialemonium thermophilum]|uniref:Zn(2)-C6 fungal-type domain-containing protein n=1 Tax=Phialemonium thermophilum TaxID=223376 RepID=A0ABR3VWW1_9PEZI